jgi:hypothetical protein
MCISMCACMLSVTLALGLWVLVDGSLPELEVGRTRRSKVQKTVNKTTQPHGYTYDHRTVEKFKKRQEDGLSPTKQGPKSTIPKCFWIAVITTLQLCQVIGLELSPSKLRTMMAAALRGTKYEKTRKGTVKESKTLLAELRKKVAELSVLQPEMAKGRDLGRWKWQVRQVLEEWWEGVENWLVAIGFGERDPDLVVSPGAVVLYKGKENRLFNNDEHKLAFSSDDQEQGSLKDMPLIDPRLPRPGNPLTKVSYCWECIVLPRCKYDLRL